MHIHFLSFGSDEYYKNRSFNILSQLCNVYPHSSMRVFQKSDLPLEIQEYGEIYQRGYGYWRWKPFLIKTYISSLEENQGFIFYVDGLSGLKNINSTIEFLDQFMVQANQDIIGWQMNHLESMYTTGDLLSSLRINPSSAIANSGQFAATFIAIRVNNRTRNFVDKWDGFYGENLNLCRDNPSMERNHHLFRENRHDQSVFSLLLKLLNGKNKINVKVLSDKEVSVDNLKIHMYPHPQKKGWGSVPCLFVI
jgi:hypothetical protein